VRGSGGSKGVEGLTGITAWSGIATSTTIFVPGPDRIAEFWSRDFSNCLPTTLS